jgi:hypothetical protein
MGAVPVFVGGPDTLGPGLRPFGGYPALAVERHRVRQPWRHPCGSDRGPLACRAGINRRVPIFTRSNDPFSTERKTAALLFGTKKSWMGSMHFQMKTLKHVDTEMALHVLAYNMKLVMHMLGVAGLMEAIRV